MGKRASKPGNPTPPQERRVRARVPLRLPLELVWIGPHGSVERARGITLNASAGGVLLETVGALPGGEVEVRHPLTRLSATARLVRQSSFRPGAARIALQFRRGRCFSILLAALCLVVGLMSTLRAAEGETSGTPAAGPAVAAQSSPAEAHPPPTVVIESSETFDGSCNLRGGLQPGGAARHLGQIGVRVDSRSFGWRGGSIYLSVQEHAGRPGSRFVGDAQGFSNIDAERRTHIGEFWFEQVFANGKLRVKAGKVDANTEFALVDHAGNFLNSSMGYSPTILVMPTYPNARLGFNAFLVPSDRFYAGLGVYDIEGAGSMPIGEAGTRWKAGRSRLPGRLGFGLWHYSGDLERFQGGTKAGTTGFFVVCDQRVWKERAEKPDDGQGIGVFFQFGTADGDVSEMTQHLGGGVEWTGALPARDADAIGFGATHVRFTRRAEAGFAGPSELALEGFYRVQVTPWLTVQPDVQYIRTPAGAASPSHALVGTVRVAVDLKSALERPGKAVLAAFR